LLNGYGITECAPGISSARFDGSRDDDGVDTLLPGVEARIVDRDGKIVRDGEVGELHVSDHNVRRGCGC
jgi:acyl-CoA synthetase (AMP-forming)/AMP-acid ligase II